MKLKRILSIGAIALIVILYVTCLALAIFGDVQSARWLEVTMYATIALPILIWLYVVVYKKWKDR